jgi:hypothetical protein
MADTISGRDPVKSPTAVARLLVQKHKLDQTVSYLHSPERRLLHASIHDMCHRKDHTKFNENRSSVPQFKVVGGTDRVVGHLINKILIP